MASGRALLAVPELALSLLLLLAFSDSVISQTVVETLPGFSGNLSFTLETGYVGVGENDGVQLFYYLVESEGDPITDPLVLWLTGGPGCSGLFSLLYENGPLKFNLSSFNGSVDSILLGKNAYSWHKVASVLYVDAPVGAGFSYAENSKAYETSDTKEATQLHTFLRNWLLNHPKFLYTPLYIGGDLDSGIIAPLLISHILEDINEGLQPIIQLKGYLLGNPSTDDYIDANSQMKYIQRVALIANSYYEDAKLYCYGDYINIASNNTLCLETLQTINACLQELNLCQVLEPHCVLSSPKPKGIEWGARARKDKSMNILHPLKRLPKLTCREKSYLISEKWVNDPAVQIALNVRLGTVENWSWCPKNFSSYTKDVNSTLSYHKYFSENTTLRALVYSGDQSAVVTYVGTLEWIKSLQVPVANSWGPWFQQGQIVGYTTKYMNDHYSLTFATVKGAGCRAAEYKPEVSLAMVDRFLNYYPLA